MRRSCLLVALLALLISRARLRRPDKGELRMVMPHQHGRGDRAAIVPAGLAGAPLLTAWWKGALEKSQDDPSHPWASGGCPMVTRTVAVNYGGDCPVKEGTGSSTPPRRSSPAMWSRPRTTPTIRWRPRCAAGRLIGW